MKKPVVFYPHFSIPTYRSDHQATLNLNVDSFDAHFDVSRITI